MDYYLPNKQEAICLCGWIIIGSTTSKFWSAPGISSWSNSFIIHIDRITKVALTAGNLSLFADDILLYRPIQNVEDFAFLQNDDTKLCSWIYWTLMPTNASIC